MTLYQIVHCVHPLVCVLIYFSYQWLVFFCVHVTVIFVNVMFKVKVAIVFMMEVHSQEMFDQLNLTSVIDVQQQ